MLHQWAGPICEAAGCCRVRQGWEGNQQNSRKVSLCGWATSYWLSIKSKSVFIQNYCLSKLRISVHSQSPSHFCCHRCLSHRVWQTQLRVKPLSDLVTRNFYYIQLELRRRWFVFIRLQPNSSADPTPAFIQAWTLQYTELFWLLQVIALVWKRNWSKLNKNHHYYIWHDVGYSSLVIVNPTAVGLGELASTGLDTAVSIHPCAHIMSSYKRDHVWKPLFFLNLATDSWLDRGLVSDSWNAWKQKCGCPRF